MIKIGDQFTAHKPPGGYPARTIYHPKTGRTVYLATLDEIERFKRLNMKRCLHCNGEGYLLLPPPPMAEREDHKRCPRCKGYLMETCELATQEIEYVGTAFTEQDAAGLIMLVTEGNEHEYSFRSGPNKDVLIGTMNTPWGNQEFLEIGALVPRRDYVDGKTQKGLEGFHFAGRVGWPGRPDVESDIDTLLLTHQNLYLGVVFPGGLKPPQQRIELGDSIKNLPESRKHWLIESACVLAFQSVNSDPLKLLRKKKFRLLELAEGPFAGMGWCQKGKKEVPSGDN